MKQVKSKKYLTIVTIIVMLFILAGIIASVLIGKNRLIAKLNIEKEVSIRAEVRNDLILSIDNFITENNGKSTLDDISESYLQERFPEYDIEVISNEDITKKEVIIKKDNKESKFLLDENFNIIKEENITGAFKFSYEIEKRENNNVKIFIIIEENENGIEKIIFPDDDILICNNKKEKVGIDYDVEIEKEYKIKILLGNGEEKEEILVINEYYYNVVLELDEGVDIDNKVRRTAGNKPYMAEITGYEHNTLLDLLSIFEVKMNGNIVINDENNIVNPLTGEIYIKNVIGNIEIRILYSEIILDVERELNGTEKILTSNTIPTPGTFTLSIEAKLLVGYYNGSNTTAVYAPLVGVGSYGSGWGGLCCGIFYSNGYIVFLNRCK